MKSSAIFKHSVLSIAFFLFFFSCDSTSSTTDSGQPPQIPDLEAIQPDISYFTDNNPMKQSDYDHFYEGKNYATTFGSLSSLGTASALWPMLMLTEGEKSGDRWIWDFTFPTEDGVFSMVLTSRESGNEFLWDMTVSISDSEVNISDYKMLEGRSSKDGNRGSWTFYSMEFEGSHQGPLLVSEWERTSDTEIRITTRFFHENGSEEGRFTYNQNGANYSLTGSSFDGNDTINIVWNTDTMSGYIEYGGERKCWNSNFQDTACS